MVMLKLLMVMKIVFTLGVISVIAIQLPYLKTRKETIIQGEITKMIPDKDKKEIWALLAIDAVIAGLMMPELLCIDGEEIAEVIEELE